MESTLQEQPQRRSRVARLEAEQRTRGTRRTVDENPEAPYERVYPTLPANRALCEHSRDVVQPDLSDGTAAETQSAELASVALLAAAAELQTQRQDVSALAEIFPSEPVERLQQALLRAGGLHAAVAAMMDQEEDGTQHPVAASTPAHPTTLSKQPAEGLPWLLTLFEDQMSATTIQHVLSCAADNFDVALDTLGELVAAADRAALSVEEYLEVLAAQASDATAAARDAARGEQASEEYAKRLLRADQADADCQRLLRKVALAAPARANRRDAQATQAQHGQSLPRDRYARQNRDGDEEQMQLDLHGLSVESSLTALDEELRRMRQLEPLCGGRRRRLLVVTGRGSHSTGPAGRAPVRAAVERHLSGARLPFTEMHGGGAFEVRV